MSDKIVKSEDEWRRTLTPEQFAVCRQKGIDYSPEGGRYLIEVHYRSRGRPFRAVHPRDLVGLITDMGGFEGVQPELTPEWIDAACASYFMEDTV